MQQNFFLAISECDKGTTTAEITLIKIAKEVSDEALVRTYSKKKDKINIPQTTIDYIIRPRIEKSCFKMIMLALEANVPLFRRNISDGRIVHI